MWHDQTVNEHKTPAQLMYLLTFHGTLVKWLPTTKRLIQVAILADEHDFSVQNAETFLLAPVPFDATIRPSWRPHALCFEDETLTGEAGRVAGTIHLRWGESYVCAEPNRRTLPANRATPDAWETFLLLDAQDLSVLRSLVAYLWDPADLPLRDPSGFWSAEVLPQFRLRVGDILLDLTVSRPQGARICAAETILLPPNPASGEAMRLTRGPVKPLRQEIALRPGPWHPSTRPGYLAPPPPRQTCVSPADEPQLVDMSAEHLKPPRFLSQSHHEFFLRKFWNDREPFFRTLYPSCRVRRLADPYVLLQRHFEGILFDESGTYSEAGHRLDSRSFYPDGLRRDFETVKVDRAVLENAVLLKGPHVVCLTPALTNYYHWLAESLLPLELLQNALPADAKLLLPANIARAHQIGGFDHRRIITLLGLDTMPMVEVAAPICRLEEAFWLEDYGIDALPGHALQKFRDRIAQRFGVTRPGKRRIYIQRLGSRRVQNADEVENFACANGFTIYRLEEVSEEAQITLFQEAEFVLAPHGAGLSNLLFCAAGTKVIELSPDVEFRPWFWIIAEKLGLSYSVLPCRMVGDHFDGAMCVDTRELAALYQLADAAV